MTRLIISTLAVFVLLLSFSIYSRANNVIPGQVGQTVVSIHTDKDGLVIVENESQYAEIIGGNVIKPDFTCPGGLQTTHDSWVALNLEDPNNLHVFLVDQINPENVQQSTIPVTPNVYGLTRNMYTRGD